jgi:hypothetical protein
MCPDIAKDSLYEQLQPSTINTARLHDTPFTAAILPEPTPQSVQITRAEQHENEGTLYATTAHTLLVGLISTHAHHMQDDMQPVLYKAT